MDSEIQQHLLVAHTISLDVKRSLSSLYGIGKRKVMAVLEKKVCEMLNTFKKLGANHNNDEINKAGEVFILLFHTRCKVIQYNALHHLQYPMCMQRLSQTTSTSQLYSNPPTPSAAKHHYNRGHFAVQAWLGN